MMRGSLAIEALCDLLKVLGLVAAVVCVLIMYDHLRQFDWSCLMRVCSPVYDRLMISISRQHRSGAAGNMHRAQERPQTVNTNAQVRGQPHQGEQPTKHQEASCQLQCSKIGQSSTCSTYSYEG